MTKCPAYTKLQQNYEYALRKWARLNFESDAALENEFGPMPSRLRQEAIEGRNKAASILKLHKETCGACNRARNKIIVGSFR